MKSRINEDFRDAYKRLPRHVREQARGAYRLFRINENHPGLHFKRLQGTDLYSVRIGRSYRALGTITGDTITWFWIGLHDEYLKLIGLS